MVEKGKGKRKKLKNGRYSDDDDDDVVSLDPQLIQCEKKKKRKNTGLNVLMELEKQGSCQLNSINETRNECHHPSCELLRENNHRLQRENDSL
ncbi:unnamed protein product [Gadus morhua 'NCC']